MTHWKFLFVVLAIAVLWGCGDGDDSNESDGGDGDTDSDTEVDGGSDTDTDGDTDTDTDADGGTDTESDSFADTDSAWDPRFDAFAEALQDDLAASDAYGVSAAILENGVVTFARAFGSRDAEGAEPLAPTALMQIGSTTKQMSAVALLRQVEKGALSVDDTLEELLPDFEFALDGSWDEQLTAHHLLSQQSGLRDMTFADPSADDGALKDFAYGGFAASEYLMNPPGAFWNYSNPNYALVGLIAETLDTRPYADLMVEDVFAPLGMARTFARKSEAEADGDYALSYGMGEDDLTTGAMGAVAMEDVPDPAFDRPAGFVWTTPTQMMTWAQFLMDGDAEVLSDALRAEMVKKHVSTGYEAGSENYGYGMFLEDGYRARDGKWYAIPVWQHGGNTISFTNILYIFPEQKFAVDICTSGYGTDFEKSLDTAITTLVDLPAPSEGPEYTFDPARLDDHVGTYNDPRNVGTVTITRQGDDLYVDMPLVASAGYTVTPKLGIVSSDIFLLYIDGEVFDLTFLPREGETASTYIRQRSFVATRTETNAARGSQKQPTREDVKRWIERAKRSPAPVRLENAR